MSVSNIKDVSLLKGTVSFEDRAGKVRTYKYGQETIKKILDGRDPADFSAKLLTPKGKK